MLKQNIALAKNLNLTKKFIKDKENNYVDI